MRAWRVNELGHPSQSLVLEEVERPEPGEGQARIRIEAVNVNFADILLCQGIYQDRPGVPFTPGLEAVGVVEAVGPGGGDAPSLSVGDRVAAMCALPAGGYAEAALVSTIGAVPMPDDIAAEVATVLFTTYQTSHVALHHRAGLSEGETVLVHAAAGGVGSAAVQIALAAGATVIATAGGPAKTEYCAAMGAHHVIDSRTDQGAQAVYDQVMAITDGRGVDIAYDPVGGELGELTRRMMGWEGRLLVIGFAAGDIPSYPANHVLVKNYSVVGVHWGAYARHGGRDVILAAHQDLVELYRAGAISPGVSGTVDLEGVPQALADLEARRIVGRCVVRIS